MATILKRRCPSCQRTKKLTSDNFGANKQDVAHGFAYWCKTCARERRNAGQRVRRQRVAIARETGVHHTKGIRNISILEQAACKDMYPNMFEPSHKLMESFCHKCPIQDECYDIVEPRKNFYTGVCSGRVFIHGKEKNNREAP